MKGSIALLVVALAGCAQAPPPPKEPAGRYQQAGTRHYSNGTEVYVVDTATGQVCYTLVTNDEKADAAVCAHRPVGGLD